MDGTGDDLLEGADRIAEFLREMGLNADRRRAFYLCATKRIPAGKLGGAWVGSKRAIQEHFVKLTSGVGAA